MADVFRGLTIRIGADTQPLQSALNSVRNSASVTQKFLKQMQGALKFDGTNVSALGKGIGLAGDRAALAARQFNLIEAAIKQTYGQTVSFGEASGLAASKVADLAADTEKVRSATQKVRSEYNRVNTEIAHIYESAAKVLSAQENISEGKALKEVRKLAKAAQDAGDEADEAKKKLKSLMQAAVTGNVTGLGENKSMGIRDRFGFSGRADEAWKLYEVYRKLQGEHDKLEADLKNLNAISSLENAKAQAIAYESEVRQIISEQGKLVSQMALMSSSPGYRNLVGDAKALDAAIDMTADSARAARAAFDAMPESTKAATMVVSSMNQEAKLLAQKIENINARLAGLKKDNPWADLNADMKNAYLVAQRAANEYDELGAAFKTAADRVEFLQESINDLGSSNGAKGAKAEVEELEKELEEARREADRLGEEFMEATEKLRRARIDEEVAKLNSELIESEGRMRALGTQMKNLTKSASAFGTLRTMGYGLYSTLTPLISIGISKMVQSAETVDSAYRDMRKTVNGTEQEFEALKKSAIDFSRTHVTTADTILEIEALGGQLGIEARNLQGFADVVSNLDIATNIDSEDLATYAGQLSNIMRDINQSDPKEYQKNITSFSDALVRLGNNSAAQESNIMKVMMRIASLGNISGFTTPQLLAISTAVAATGQGAEAAGTAISRTFSNIEAAVGKGGEKLEKFAKVSGMSAESFANAWNNDPQTAFKSFIAGLKRIDESGGSVDRTLADLGINSVRQKQALEGLTNTYDVLTQSLNMAQDAWDGQSTTMADGRIEEAGDAAREAQRKSEGFSGAIQMMRNNATALSESMGEGLLPIVQLVGVGFEYLTGVVSDMSPAMKTAAVGILGVVAAAGPALIAIGAIGSGWHQLSDFLANLGGSRTMRSVIGAIEGVQGAFTKLGNSSRFAGTRVGSLSTSLGKLSTLKFAGVATGVLLAVGAVKSLVDYFQEVEEHQRELTEGFESVSKEAARTGALDEYADRVKLAGDAAYNSSEAVEKLSQSFRDHGSAMKANNDAAEATIASMNTVEEVFDEYAGAAARGVEYEKLSTEEKGRIEYALKQLESQLGVTVSAQDLLNGTYRDEEGTVKSLTDRIHELIDAKREEARVSAATDNLTEAYKAQSEARKSYEEMLEQMKAAEEEAYQNFMLSGSMTEEDARASAAESAYQSFAKNLEAAEGAIRSADDAVAAATQDLGAAVGEAGKIGEVMQGFGSDFYLKVSESVGSMSDFAIALSDAGISAESLKTLGSDAFLQLFEIAGSSTSGIINAFNLMAAAGVTDLAQLTDGTWTLDAATGTLTGQDHIYRITDNGAVIDMIGLVNSLNQTAEGTEQGYTIDYDSGQILDAQGNVVDLETALSQIDGQTYSASIAIDTTSAESNVNALISRIQAAQSEAANVGKQAAGGIFPTGVRAFAAGAITRSALRAIPANASGGINGIVTRATMTNVGWVGEAGDEAVFNMRHAGGAIIPLSNRQHVRPFARAVASEMPYGGSSTVYNFSIDGAVVNDDPHVRDLFIELLTDMQRRRAMNRG